MAYFPNYDYANGIYLLSLNRWEAGKQIRTEDKLKYNQMFGGHCSPCINGQNIKGFGEKGIVVSADSGMMWVDTLMALNPSW